MTGPTWLRLRKRLDATLPAAIWPQGIMPAAFESVDPRRLHALLDEAFPGLVARFEDWYGNLTTDPEFDAALCVVALAPDGGIAGFAQCWTIGFVKDLAVAQAHRGKGVGEALMRHVFALFAGRGLAQVDLKVATDEQAARRLYARLGMIEV